MNTFGKLRWIFTTLNTHVNFLDLMLALSNGRMETTLSEK